MALCDLTADMGHGGVQFHVLYKTPKWVFGYKTPVHATCKEFGDVRQRASQNEARPHRGTMRARKRVVGTNYFATTIFFIWLCVGVSKR